MFGLIATNTIGQGDTRDVGSDEDHRRWRRDLARHAAAEMAGRSGGCGFGRAYREGRSGFACARYDGRCARISAYLVEGELDTSPVALAANSGKAFMGSYVLGMGFTFDDVAAAKGEAESLETMRALIAKESEECGADFSVHRWRGDQYCRPRINIIRYVIDFRRSESER